jgi:hypothetical protein
MSNDIITICKTSKGLLSRCNNINQQEKAETPMEKGDTGRALVTHACNPSYLGGRDQEDCGFEDNLGKQLTRLYL